MPSLTVQLTPDGPIVPLALLVSTPRRNAMVAAGLPIPAPVVIKVLVDTGASSTCIDAFHLAKLGISPTGLVGVHTPSTGGRAVQANQFDVDIGIMLSQGRYHFVDTLPVVESNLSAQGIDGLLGRDVLSQGIFIYNGEASIFTLSF